MSQKCQFDFNNCRDGGPELRNVIDFVIDYLVLVGRVWQLPVHFIAIGSAAKTLKTAGSASYLDSQ